MFSSSLVPMLRLAPWGLVSNCIYLAQGQEQQLPMQSTDNRLDFNAYAVRDTYNRDLRFGFGEGTYMDPFTLTEDIDAQLFADGVNGMISVATGSSTQEHNFEVLVRISSSTSESVLDTVLVEVAGQVINLRALAPPPSSERQQPEKRPDIKVKVAILVRPHTLQFGLTNIDTKNLDIKLWPGLDFETYHLNLHTSLGSVTSSEVNLFTAHEINIEAYSASITGTWSLPSSISFTSVNGDIDVDLIPKRWSTGPWTRGDLKATTQIGDISIRMPLQRDQLALRNYTAQLSTVVGSIRAELVHGALTDLMTYIGDINATLLTHWAFAEWQGVQHNYIRTDVTQGSTYIDVLPSVDVDFYVPRPLCFAVSRHRVAEGNMELAYPRDWCGTAAGVAEEGTLEIEGEDFEVIETREKWAKRVQRRPLGSDLGFLVKKGDGKLILK